MSVEVTKLGLQAALCTALAAVMIGGCGGPVDEDSTEQAFAASASRLQNQEAQFLRRCLSVTGDEGTRVRTAICSQLDENQGIIYAAGSTKQWLQGQTTGRAKCLAVTAVGNIIHAVCAENTASQRWVKVPHSDRFSYTYQNAGRCLTLNASGALSAASCDSESLAQRWRTGVDRTLDEVFSYGVVSSADVPTQAPDLTIPATQETIDYTGGAITRWEATYISFQPSGVAYESFGMVVVGRDRFNAPRFYFRGLHVRNPAKPKDVHHTWKIQLPHYSSSGPTQELAVDAVNDVPTRPIVNHLLNSTAHMTAVALLIRDTLAASVARGSAPEDAAIRRVVVAEGSLTELSAVALGTAIVVAVASPVSSVIIPFVAGGIVGSVRGRMSNPPGGTPNCSSTPSYAEWLINHSGTIVDGDAGQCLVSKVPAACAPRPDGLSVHSCGLQNTHGLPPIITHGKIFCTTKIEPHPGKTCTKHRLPKPEDAWCAVDCTQQQTLCEWSVCQIPTFN